jgi:DMSO/TMAO reductase YedYZ molybdopterin-dependent catalytic subunit
VGLLEHVRAGRRTNLALLVVLVLAIGTGALAFAFGTGWAWWAVAAHGAAGLALVLLSPWKAAISARGLRRERSGAIASVALAVFGIVAVASGVAHAAGVWTGTLAMQVHVGSALLSIPLIVWHVVARPVRPRRTDLSRRALVRGAALAGGSVATLGAMEGLVRLVGLRGSERRFTGSYERGSFDVGEMPVTQWLDDQVPVIDASMWRLEVRAVENDGVADPLTLEELDGFDDRVRATLDCTGGWFAEQIWSGVRLDRLVDGTDEEVRSVLAVSATGYARRFPIADVRHMWLATRVGDEVLSPGHGYPLRLVAPGRRGFWWVKWVERIEVSSTPWWWQSPFPLT